MFEIETAQYRKQILKTLEFIMNNSDFASLSGDQAKLVYIAYSKLTATTSDEWHFKIAQLEIPISNDELVKHDPTLLIGGIIEGGADSVIRTSFSLCVTFTTDSSNLEKSTNISSGASLNVDSCCLNMYRDKKRIVRRFHFDSHFADNIKPTSHIQYGGKFPDNERHRDCHYCLEYFLENPRFHYPPMDLVLVLDLILREFETPLKKWTRENYWRGLVFKSQELCWKDYWNKSIGHINRLSGRTLHEWIYDEAN